MDAMAPVVAGVEEAWGTVVLMVGVTVALPALVLLVAWCRGYFSGPRTGSPPASSENGGREDSRSRPPFWPVGS